MVEEKKKKERRGKRKERDGTVSTGKSVTVEMQDVCFWAFWDRFFFSIAEKGSFLFLGFWLSYLCSSDFLSGGFRGSGGSGGVSL